jgi:hypothetical protein
MTTQEINTASLDDLMNILNDVEEYLSESEDESEPISDTTDSESDLDDAIASYKKMGFVPIPFGRLQVKDGKKNYIGLPQGWNKLTIDTPTNAKPTDTGICILTGKPSGITVFDFDDEGFYLNLLQENPELRDFYTVKTARGYHVYFNYDPNLKCANDVCDLRAKAVDIKNDGGHCTTAPTSYGDFSYCHLNHNELTDIPEFLMDILNDRAFKGAPAEEPEPTPQVKHLEVDMETKMKIVDLINVKPYLDEYDSWRRIVFAMKHEGYSREFAQKISKKSKTFKEEGFINHWDRAPTTINVSQGTLNRYAKLSNPEGYKELTKKEKPKKDPQEIKKMIEENAEISRLSFSNEAKKFEAEGNAKLRNGKYITRDNDGFPIIVSKTEMKERYDHLSYEGLILGKLKPLSFIKAWMSANPDIKMYDDADIYPPGVPVPENHINLWIPFDMERIDDYTPVPEVIDFMTNHLRIMCDHEEAIFEHLNTWMAHMLHRPSVKTKQMPIIIAKQGAGKTSLVEMIRAMIGSEKIADVSDPKTVCGGDFNGPLMNAYLVHMSELSKSKIDIDKLKHIITEPHISIVKKGKDPMKINSFHNFIAPTNNNDPVPTGGDDRRLMIVRASDELIGNVAYFNKFYEYINDKNAMKTLYEYYRTVKIPENFNKLKPPTTKHHQELKTMSRNVIEQWLEAFIIEEVRLLYPGITGPSDPEDPDSPDAFDTFIESDEFKASKDEKGYSSTHLYDDFKEWRQSNGINYEVSAPQFNMRVHNMRIDGITVKKTKKCNMKVFKFAEVLKSLNESLNQ